VDIILNINYLIQKTIIHEIRELQTF